MQIKSIICSFLTLVVSLGAQGEEFPVEDVVLLTNNRECAIHYITDDNVVGWTISYLDGNCSNGYLDGYGKVVISNAFGSIMEEQVGEFNQGYFTEKLTHNIKLRSLYLNNTNTQALVFDYEPDEELGVNFYGRLHSQKNSQNIYSKFMACEPAWILAVVDHPEMLEDTDFQHKLVKAAITRVKTVCEGTPQIQLYASDMKWPENKDIMFFATINIEDKSVKVQRLPSSERRRNLLAHPMNIIPTPKEIRQEIGEKVVTINPLSSEDNKEVIHLNEASKGRIIPVSLVPPDQSRTPSKVDLKSLDIVPNLLTASRLLSQPVEGRVLVHISGFDEDGVAIIDQPLVLKAKGTGLSLGWGIAEGNFIYLDSKNKLDGAKGVFEIKQFLPYAFEENK